MPGMFRNYIPYLVGGHLRRLARLRHATTASRRFGMRGLTGAMRGIPYREQRHVIPSAARDLLLRATPGIERDPSLRSG